MTESPGKRIEFLDSIRAIAIIMVVGVHATGYCLPLSHSVDAIIKFVIYQISVPVFFLVDGYLFAKMFSRPKDASYLPYVRKSAWRLLLPWVLFTLVYTIMRYIFEKNNFLNEHLIVGISTPVVLKNLYGSLFAGQLYFLLSLFLIRLFFPLTRRMVAWGNNKAIFITIAYVVFYHVSLPIIEPFLKVPGQDPILNALWGAQFYLSGISLYLFKSLISDLKTTLVLLVLFICFTIIKTLIVDTRFVGLTTEWLYLLSLFCVMNYFQFRISILKLLGENTMGIYLIHVPIVMKLLSIITNRITEISIISYALIVFGSLLISLLLTICIHQIPHGYLIFGEVKKSTQNY